MDIRSANPEGEVYNFRGNKKPAEKPVPFLRFPERMGASR